MKQVYYSNPAVLPDMQSLSVSDRPREKLFENGVHTLSDLDLLAVILGKGQRNKPVYHLAAEILPLIDGNFDNSELTDVLSGISGLGPARTAMLIAAREFMRRRFAQPSSRVRGPGDVFSLVRHYSDRPQEHFLCITLNGGGEVIRTRVISIGLLNQSLVHPREVFADAVSDRAASVIAAHNHPSGNLIPSPEDLSVTARLKEAGELLKIPLLDHVIFSHTGYHGIMSGLSGSSQGAG